MIKQAVLFVASTGFLLYFITPADSDNQKPSTIQEASEPKPKYQQNLPAPWDADSDAEEEEFVFGEPLVYSDTDETIPEKNDEYSSAAPQVAKISRKPNFVNPAIYSETPKPGQPGSRENPIDLSPPGGRQKN